MSRNSLKITVALVAVMGLGFIAGAFVFNRDSEIRNPEPSAEIGQRNLPSRTTKTPARQAGPASNRSDSEIRANNLKFTFERGYGLELDAK